MVAELASAVVVQLPLGHPMPRPNRIILPGVPTHVIQRGHNRSTCFFSQRDFAEYREVLRETSQRCRCAIHAYVLMTNHVHLLVSTLDSLGVSRMMQMIGRRYVRAVNIRRRRTGTLWEGRFKSSIIDSERYFLTCSRYIELNPVRARMVDDVGTYQWSSYRHNAYGEHDSLVTSFSLYDALGASPQVRRKAYRALFRQAIEPESLDGIRSAVKRGAALGDSNFVQRLEKSAKRRVARFPHGGDRRSPIFELITAT
jgi:putative transposase